MKITKTLFTTLTLLSIGTFPNKSFAAETAVPFKNLTMEEGTTAISAWQKGVAVPGVEQTWDKSTAHGGKGSLCLKKTAKGYFPIAAWRQSVSVEASPKPRKLRVTGWVKAESVTKAILDVGYQTEKPGHVWAVYIGQKKQSDPIVTHDWKRYEETVTIPANASKLELSLQIYGPGTIWFDDLEAVWIE